MTETQAQILEAMFRKDTLSQADRNWLGGRILDGSIPPETAQLIEARWPAMVERSRHEFRVLGVVALILLAGIATGVLVAYFRSVG